MKIWKRTVIKYSLAFPVWSIILLNSAATNGQNQEQSRTNECFAKERKCAPGKKVFCNAKGRSHWLTSKQMMKLVIEKKPISSGTIGKNNLQGTVTMKVLLDSNGDVLCVEAIKGHPIAKTLAVSAIHQWKFKAYKVKGKSVSVVGFLVVPYDLRK